MRVTAKEMLQKQAIGPDQVAEWMQQIMPHLQKYDLQQVKEILGILVAWGGASIPLGLFLKSLPRNLRPW